jgi:hypothetical protein
VRKDLYDFLIGVFPLTIMRLATRLMYGPEIQLTMRAGGCVRNGLPQALSSMLLASNCRLFSLDIGVACLLAVCSCTCSNKYLFLVNEET